MKLISWHYARHCAVQTGPEGQKKLLIVLCIFNLLLTKKLTAIKKKKGQYLTINQLTGSKASLLQEAPVSGSLFRNQVGLCCNISKEQKEEEIDYFLQSVIVIVLLILCIKGKALMLMA